MDKIEVLPHNEVFYTLDTDDGILQEISDLFTFKVPGYQFMPLYKNKMWDGNIRLFNVNTRKLYIGLRYHLQEFAKQRNYEIKYQVEVPEKMKVDDMKFVLKQIKSKIKPRDYQIKAFLNGVERGRGLYLSPTASGKSLIIYMLIQYCLMVHRKKALIIVPTTTLVHQMAADFADYGYEGVVHKIFAGQEKQSDCKIHVTTWQSIYKERKTFYDPYCVIIGDEAHLFKAKSLTSIMEKAENVEHRFGFTGTLDGTQTHKLMLEALYDKVTRVAQTSELIKQNYLASLRIKCIVLKYNNDDKKLVKGLDYQKEIDFIVQHKGRMDFIRNLALNLKGNTLVLFQFVEKHGKIIFNELNKYNKDKKIFYVSGEVDGNERNDIRGLVEKDDNSIVVASYGTFSTGVNIRRLHNIIFSSPTKSRIRNLQSIGRGLRLGDEKDYCTLYDIADDLTWNARQNFALKHFVDRTEVYDEENFEYTMYNYKV
jgi:superfamily II DNA or RNA helicase